MKKVLVIDDEPDTRTFLSAVLTDNGYQVCTAADGIDGFQVAKEQRPDVVSLDLLMPNKTGTEFFRRLKRDKEVGGTPIVVVSGLAGRHLAVKDAVAVLEKPIDPEQFLRAVEKALGG